jgi:nitronate monooxygenase
MANEKFEQLKSDLRLPLIAAPMFLVSGPDLVVAACSNGVIGSFPTANCRTSEELDHWMQTISERLQSAGPSKNWKVGPVCPNLIVHKSNTRVQDDLAVLLKHKPTIVITSVGPPTPVLEPLHDIGALVFADVATVAHAKKTLAAGADGLVLLTAWGGGTNGMVEPVRLCSRCPPLF